MMKKNYVRYYLYLLFLFGAFTAGCLNLDEQVIQGGNAIQGENVPQWQPLTTFGRGQAIALSIAPNGRWMAIQSTTGVYLYDARTWSRLDLGIPQEQADQMAFSPDGNLLALALPAYHEIQIWRLPEARLVRNLPTDQPTVQGLVFTPQGNRLISRSFQAIDVWRMQDGAHLQTFKPPEGTEFRQASLSSDGMFLGTPLLGRRVNTVLFWRIGEEGPLAAFTGAEVSWFSAGRFWPAGNLYGLLVSETSTGTAEKLLVLDPLDGRIVLEIDPSAEISSAAWLFDEDRSLLVTGHDDGKVIFWSSETREAVMTLPAPVSGSVQTIQIDSGGSRLVAVYAGGHIGFWSVPDGKLVHMIETAESESPIQITIQPDGQRLIGIMPNGRLRVWDMNDGQEIAMLEDHAAGEVRSLAFSPDGNLLAAGQANGLVRLWQTNTNESSTLVLDHKARVDSVAFSPDGKYMVTGVGERINALVYDDTVRLWELGHGNLLWQFAGEQEDVLSCTAFRNRLAFSPDGSLLAVTSHDFSVQIWDVNDRKLLRTLEGHTEPVLDLTMSSDGTTLASVSLDGTIRLWRVSDGVLRRSIQAEPLGMAAVAFSPDGQYLAGGSLKGELYLWDAASGQVLRKMEGGFNTLSALAFSADGTLVAAGNGSDLHIWSANTGKLVATLPGESGNIISMAFSRDGSLLAFGSDRGLIQLWKVKG
jgi:WD40 repeat protein